MKRSRFIILALAMCGTLACVCAACHKSASDVAPHVSESMEFQPTDTSGTAVPVTAGLLRGDYARYMDAQDGAFHPDEAVTRGQMAQIVCRLLDEEEAAGATGSAAAFTDLPVGSPLQADVEKLAALGVLGGYGDGTFRPDEPVTRGEAVAMLCRLAHKDEVAALAFDDVGADHWAMGSVAAAMTSGWLSGYQDGDFYPDAPLKRAEAVVLLNRARGWTPNKAAIDLACETSPYQDVSQGMWAYYDIVDASYTNELLSYIMDGDANAEPGLLLLGEHLCHVNAEHRLDYFEKGFHTFQDGLDTDGIYYAPEDGYFLQRFRPGLQEVDGSLFYVPREDGPFATHYELGYLYFGDNGRYTTGDAEVDGYVDAILADIIQGQTSNLLNEDKLREAYNVLLFGDYDYMTRPVGWIRGSVGWSLECAKTMYETKRGSCYFWAAAFLYLARRLGFQAYPVCGGVNENNALHAWVMIDHGDIDDNDVNTEESKNEATRIIDPDEYIYDIELDWAYRTGAHGRVPIRPGRDLFKQTRGQSVCIYIFPGDTWTEPPMDDTDALGNQAGNNNDGTGPDAVIGDDMVEGVDYTVSYNNNGDGTITVTITYLTGASAGTSTSYTIADPDYDPNNPQPTTDPTTPTTDPTVPTTDPTAPTTDPTVPTTDPTTPTTDPTVPTTDPNGGTVTDPNAGVVTDPNAGTVPDPNAGVVPDPNAGTGTDPNAGTVPDPNAGTGTIADAGTDGSAGAGEGQPSTADVAEPSVNE